MVQFIQLAGKGLVGPEIADRNVATLQIYQFRHAR
jgi:hypothetical protein